MSETQSKRHPHLTKSEVHNVRAILAGCTTAKKFKELYDINPRTLQTHLCRIYKKTGADNKADVILMALDRKKGLIDVAGQLNRWSKQRAL